MPENEILPVPESKRAAYENIGTPAPSDPSTLLARAGAEIIERRATESATRTADPKRYVSGIRALLLVLDAAQALRPHLGVIAEALDDAAATSTGSLVRELVAAGNALDALQAAVRACGEVPS